LAILGTLFALLDYPGQGLMLKIGAVSMSIPGLIYLFGDQTIRSKNVMDKVVRIALIITLGLAQWLLLMQLP
jgi:hypothetical protein